MSENLHLVFSIPAPSILSVSDKEYHRWYRFHMAEILEAPLWDAGRRYALETMNGTGLPSEYPYLAAYEVGTDIQANLASLGKAGEARQARDGYTPPPAWVAENRYASWDCISLEDRGDFKLPEHVYFVLSETPAGMSFEDYSDWYHGHVEEILDAPGFVRAWRFRMEPTLSNDAAPATWTHLAAYEVTGEIRARLTELTATREALGQTNPAWFRDVALLGIDAYALTERVDGSHWLDVKPGQAAENERVIKEFRENAGDVEHYKFPVVLLHHKGAKSGVERISPLACLPVDGELAIFATRAGSPEHPAWYHNLVANPRTTIEYGTETYEVVARLLSGRERNRIWTLHKIAVPGAAHSDQVTTREIPAFLLERVR